MGKGCNRWPVKALRLLDLNRVDCNTPIRQNQNNISLMRFFTTTTLHQDMPALLNGAAPLARFAVRDVLGHVFQHALQSAHHLLKGGSQLGIGSPAVIYKLAERLVGGLEGWGGGVGV